MYSKHFPEIIKPLGRDLVFNIKNPEKAIYITFDDGPHPEITPWVMEQLARFDAKATFFLVGENAETYPSIAIDLINAGHAVGNHSYHHLSGWKTENALYFENIDRCRQIVESNLFRPPYGQITRSQAKFLKQDYKIIMWSDLSADFDPKYSPEDCFKFATRKVELGSIIVFHDSEKAWPRLEKAFPMCLEYYAKQGFKMLAIS